MTPFTPNSDTNVCMSFAAQPGNFGNKFHNYLFRAMDLNYIYISRKINDLSAAVHSLRSLNIRGCGVTMPFKVEAVALVDEFDDIVRRTGALNTIVNDEGRLIGYNTDYWAVDSLLKESGLGKRSYIELLGSGGISSAIALALHLQGFSEVTVRSRSLENGQAIAKSFGFKWKAWGSPFEKVDAIMNATSIGFKEPAAFKFPLPDEILRQCAVILDVVANPVETSLIRRARELNVKAVGGPELSKRQALRQFQLYTGINPSPDLVEKAVRAAVS